MQTASWFSEIERAKFSELLHRSRAAHGMSTGGSSSEQNSKRFLCVNRRAPHGTIYALESLEVVLAATAFEQRVTVLFLDDGVFQLVKNQNTDALGVKNFSPTYKALEMYEVERVVVERESLDRRGISEDDLIIPVEVLAEDEISELFESHDILLNF